MIGHLGITLGTESTVPELPNERCHARGKCCRGDGRLRPAAITGQLVGLSLLCAYSAHNVIHS
jgi:hypothetical protein